MIAAGAARAEVARLGRNRQGGLSALMMRSWAASAGVARFVWTRHRRLLSACLLFYIAVYAAGELFGTDPMPSWLRAIFPLLRFAPVVLPLTLFVTTASAVTLDLASPESRYPGYFLTLPVSRAQLVLPFMVGALLLAALLWAAGFAVAHGNVLMGPGPVRPELRGVSTGVESVPFLLASGVAWLQALIWMSFRGRRTRVWFLLAITLAHFTLLVVTVAHTVSTLAAIATCVLSIGIAFGVASWGVGRARRGDPAFREAAVTEVGTRKLRRIVPRVPFASPLDAQQWFERQAHGARNKSIFLLIVPFVLAVAVAATFAGHLDTKAPPGPAAALAMVSNAALVVAGLYTLLAVVIGPSCASFSSRISWSYADDFTMPSFFAALPLTTGDFAWAKLRLAARASFWLVGLIVLFSLPIALLFGQLGLWVVVFDALRAQYGSVEAVLRLTLVPLSLAAFMAACSASVVWTALFGRGWKLMSVVVTLLGSSVFVWAGWRPYHPEWFEWLSASAGALLPWAVVLKVGALAWLAHLVGTRYRHYSRSRVVWIVAIWLVAVVAAWAAAMHLFPHLRASTILFTSIVAMPVLGILAAPLALQLNRTR